jgi:DNA-binding MurR/RpiR family transcriptional regulator
VAERSASGVRKAIEAEYTRLRGQKRRVADYVLAHQTTIFSLSVQELGRLADVSEATVVRFARDIGFAGYQELRAALTGEAKADLSPEGRFAAEASRGTSSTLAKVAAQEIGNIERTLATLDSRELDRFVDLLRAADPIATVGAGVGAILARLAAYQLQLVGRRARALVGDELSPVEQAELLPRGAALLAFSFPPYSRHPVRAAQRARERRLPVLAITDAVRSPLRDHATSILYMHADNLLFTNSVSAALVVVNALVTDLALADKGRALGQLRALNAVAADDHLGPR